MNSFRKLASTAVLTLGALAVFPSLAAAQSVAGSFTLSHEVNWQHAVVPAGTYRFSLESRGGPSQLLTLRKLNGDYRSFIIVANDVSQSKASDLDQLVLVSRSGKSFVSSLELPEFETTLHFAYLRKGRKKN
jgi:hypothetical protein